MLDDLLRKTLENTPKEYKKNILIFKKTLDEIKKIINLA